MAPPPPPPPPRCRPRPTTFLALMKELVEEILLRIPSDEPAHLFRAALVCKPWRRILTDPDFLRRYRAFHGAPPPLLGYLHNLVRDNRSGIPPLAPTTAAASPLSTTTLLPEFEGGNWVLDCRHGRVLVHVLMPKYDLVVWNPITGVRKNIILPDYHHFYYAGAVLCAVDGCDHLDCHDGPFMVVFAGSSDHSGNDLDTWVAIYSSETGQWSAPISIHDNCAIQPKPPLLIRDTLYFSAREFDIVKFELGAHELSTIKPPVGFSQQAIFMEVDGGGLGFVCVDGNCLYMLSWQGDANGGTGGGWIQHLVIELKKLFPSRTPFCPHEVVGLLEGTTTVFISVAGVGLFTLDLKSRKVKKVGKEGAYYVLLPYTSFYTPDLACGKLALPADTN